MIELLCYIILVAFNWISLSKETRQHITKTQDVLPIAMLFIPLLMFPLYKLFKGYIRQVFYRICLFQYLTSGELTYAKWNMCQNAGLFGFFFAVPTIRLKIIKHWEKVFEVSLDNVKFYSIFPAKNPVMDRISFLCCMADVTFNGNSWYKKLYNHSSAKQVIAEDKYY